MDKLTVLLIPTTESSKLASVIFKFTSSSDKTPINVPDTFVEEGNQCIKIPTLEGEMIASIRDYIIRGIKGEYYPCKPDIFEATYEKVENI